MEIQNQEQVLNQNNQVKKNNFLFRFYDNYLGKWWFLVLVTFFLLFFFWFFLMNISDIYWFKVIIYLLIYLFLLIGILSISIRNFIRKKWGKGILYLVIAITWTFLIWKFLAPLIFLFLAISLGFRDTPI